MMAKNLVLISIFVDGTNKLKKATKVKNVKEIQDQAKKMYPSIGEATLDRFMVYSNDFEEFVDVDKSHKVEAKEKYKLYFLSLQTSPTPRATAPSTPSKETELPQTPSNDISPAMVGRLRACPSLYNMQSCLMNKEVRNASQIYRKNLTKYRKGINECAHQLALKDPLLLQNRGTLLKLAQEALYYSGFAYKRNSVIGKARLESQDVFESTNPKDSSTREHLYSPQSHDLGENSQVSDPPDVEQAIDHQSGSQTSENVCSEQTDGSADVVADFEALVETVIGEERSVLDSTMPVTPYGITQEGKGEAELKKASMIFGRSGKLKFSNYHIRINEMAFRVALEKPHLVDKRRQLYIEAQKMLYYSGYKYSRINQTRSWMFQAGGVKQDQPQTKKFRDKRCAEVDLEISSLKEEVAIITKSKTKLVVSEEAELLDERINEMLEKIVSLESEKRKLKEKDEYMKRKKVWKENARKRKQREREKQKGDDGIYETDGGDAW